MRFTRFTFFVVFCGLLVAGLAGAPTALAQDGGAAGDGGVHKCIPPRVLIVLDKSSSMVGTVGGKTKWQIAYDALKKVLETYDKSVDFGLLVFPDPSQCGWGKVKVGIGPGNAKAILAQLTTPPPSAGNWTPMAQSLDVAATVKNLQDKKYSNNVLLITDGWQWCDPYDAKTRSLPVSSAAALKAVGITTYVVGFGDGVDVLTLNKTAEAAGTKVSASCDVKSTDHKAKNNCYYQANDPSALIAALQSIALKLTQEVCDDIDNDCDGKTDEGLSRACTSLCGSGTEVCQSGTWVNCSAKQPTAEKCDGLDNDCDGQIDEGCACKNGETRACGTDTGECQKGTQTCTAGTWGSTCAGSKGPETEKCDGKDNDCDSQTDEHLTQSCTTKCGTGTQTCTGGAWGTCSAPAPTSEICDGKDNDCDGKVDGSDVKCPNGGVCIGGICKLLKPDAGGPQQDSGSGGNPFDPIPDAEASGCDCRVASAPVSEAVPALLLGLALLLVGARRRG